MIAEPLQPARIFLESSAQDYGLTQELLARWPSVPVRRIHQTQEAVDFLTNFADPLAEGKRSLLITRQRGPFIKPCPGTRKYICCGYRIINVTTGCHLDCTYCVLQRYLSIPLLTVYVNRDELVTQLDDLLSSGRDRFYRLGTGELTDSLGLDPLLHHARLLVPYFADKSNAILELKTKTTHVDELMDLKHGGRTVVSWSLNAEPMARAEEHPAPPISERLRAAQRCYHAGYRIGFHFDPLIDYPGWKENYRQVVDSIFRHIDPDSIAWISLGALRYPPPLEEIIRRRHPQSEIVLGELLPGKDGKLRYLRTIRTEMFRCLHTWIKEHDPGIFVYLCMESDQVWHQALGWSPGNMATLSKHLDERVKP
jgi:spore photoproduct lyase